MTRIKPALRTAASVLGLRAYVRARARTHTHTHTHTTRCIWHEGQGPRDPTLIQAKNWEGLSRGLDQDPCFTSGDEFFWFFSPKGKFKNLQQITPNSLKVIKNPASPSSLELQTGPEKLNDEETGRCPDQVSPPKYKSQSGKLGAEMAWAAPAASVC